ncbi:hypothetical protein LEMLEM_LOCUS18040 [Lemmus lemmus]
MFHGSKDPGRKAEEMFGWVTACCISHSSQFLCYLGTAFPVFSLTAKVTVPLLKDPLSK